MASSNPWDPVQPTAAGLMLARALSAGVVSQINLETEALQMEKDTADITHPFYLTQKCQALQAMNRHLDAVLKNKRTLRQRLVKPLCRENLPVEAAFHRDVVELLALAVAFIEKLETHLLTIRNIPEIPENIRNMRSALAKMDLLVTETEELAEQILEWREKQKGIFENTQLIGELDSFFKSIR
ncbi:HAUS augmin-like complex subunit 2 isoform X3 [Pantherophis guttatus]|uniref:HAUS augmin-like complex subunit 2 isoform X3 n=1 Tax=Pantherophis guttatus TaxID=94885 RepID=A0A6P9BQU5_PANGU|nr:HAUS augmin-like complex subunit 2 isoform X3 [Pantherophis guttatus]